MYECEKQEVIDCCLSLVRSGEFVGTWGNVSMRVGDCLVVTPSRVPYDEMEVDDMVVLALDGTVLESPRAHVPTSEREVHRQIYLKRADVRAVVHAHTPRAMAVSTLPVNKVPCLVEEMSQLLGGAIPLTKEYVPAEHHLKLGQAVAEVIGERNAAVMRNHGPVACGRNLAEAELAATVAERSCDLYLQVVGLSPQLIPESYVASERRRFLYSYGKEN